MIISPQPVDARGNPQPTGSAREIGKDDFLRLFVTKLKHQDPINPMEDEAFIAQLAQFSSLEQLTNLNQSLESSIQWDVLNNQTINNSVAAQLIGDEIVANLSEVFLSADNQPRVSFELDKFASSVQVDILDSSGETIRTIKDTELQIGRNSFVWDGKTDSGERAPEGSYSLQATATDADGIAFTPSLSIVGIVNGVVYRGGIAFLKIDGAEVALGDVREISRAAA
ncbi:MAG: flagellar hook assembly protein FlgD [Candidatus Zixiibacteriota bacterium]